MSLYFKRHVSAIIFTFSKYTHTHRDNNTTITLTHISITFCVQTCHSAKDTVYSPEHFLSIKDIVTILPFLCGTDDADYEQSLEWEFLHSINDAHYYCHIQSPVLV